MRRGSGKGTSPSWCREKGFPAGSCWNAGRAAPGLNPSLQGHCPSSLPNWGVSEGLLWQSPSGGRCLHSYLRRTLRSQAPFPPPSSSSRLRGVAVPPVPSGEDPDDLSGRQASPAVPIAFCLVISCVQGRNSNRAGG